MFHRVLPWSTLSILCLACGATTSSSTTTTRPPSPMATSLAAPQPGGTPEEPEPFAAQPSGPTAPASVSLLSFERVLQVPVRSIAVGKPPRVAVLADDPWLLDTEGWQKKPLPHRYVLAPGSRIQVFFGRDNRPRLMGTTAVSQDGAGTEAIYLRLKRAGWQKEPSEIGRLAGPPDGGLFGVLGHDDPEVVCKVGDVCIVKRLTGWTTLPAGPGMPRVFMEGGEVWALHPDRVSSLTDAGWKNVEGVNPWSNPTGLWGSPKGALWVSVAAEDALYHYEGGRWQRVDSPVKAPHGLWGTNPSDVWVTGEDGAGHYDGMSWSKVAGPIGPLEVVTGAGAQDVWMGGRSGLWHGRGEVR